MTKVEIKTEKIEIVEIEVPDYSEELNDASMQCEELKNKTDVLNKKIKCAKDNSIKQIEAYLLSIFAPFFNPDGTINSRNLSALQFQIYDYDNNPCLIVKLTYSYDGDFYIYISKDKVYGLSNSSDYYMLGIIKRWEMNKRDINSRIVRSAVNSISQAVSDCSKAEQTLDIFTNFKA